MSQLSKTYALNKVTFKDIAFATKEFDGNCNSYTAFLLKSLRASPPPLANHPEAGLIERDSNGNLYLRQNMPPYSDTSKVQKKKRLFLPAPLEDGVGSGVHLKLQE